MVLCRWAVEPGRAQSQRAQVFPESLGRVCRGSERASWPQLWRVGRPSRLGHMGAQQPSGGAEEDC